MTINLCIREVNTRLEKQVKQRTEKIALQNQALEKSKNEILSSIKYAKRIQLAILPSDEQIKDIAPNLFVYYSPKDVVSGDFYFVEQTKTSDTNATGYSIIAAVDCTGHGVPGVFMSIVGNNLFKQSLGEKYVNSPGAALDYLNEGVIKNLQRKNVDGATIKDGMDIAMCAIKNDFSELVFSGAKNLLYFIRKKSVLCDKPMPDDVILREETEALKLFEIKGDRTSIGSDLTVEKDQGYQNHQIDLEVGDKFFIFSDGYADQFGGPDGKKFRYKRFRELLLETYALSPEEEKLALDKVFVEWRGDTEQIDDVLVMGMRIDDQIKN
ncbi:MAG: PP2C family protein-serine/threonine phosphatase [Crocinitomicaceae bacterium]